MDEIANFRHNPRQPWVGQTAFAHKGGMHVNAVQKVARSYEHIDPALVGNGRSVLVSDLAGRSNIVMKAQELGFQLTNDTPELKAILDAHQGTGARGLRVRGGRGSLALLISRALKHSEPPFSVDGYHVSMRRDGSESDLRGDGQGARRRRSARHTVAEGDGPVNALDRRLRAALVKFYPQLKKVALTDYKVRILDSATGTAAKTRVLIESTDGKREWGTVGVNDNIIEASLQALVDSMEYALMKK